MVVNAQGTVVSHARNSVRCNFIGGRGSVNRSLAVNEASYPALIWTNSIVTLCAISA
jgi:hypothetical protein